MPPKKSVNRICLTILQIIWVITAAKVYKKAGPKVILSQLLREIIDCVGQYAYSIFAVFNLLA